MSQWIDRWAKPQHTESRKAEFLAVDNHLNFAPVNILDIGCGLAKESEYFQKKYNSNLWLLEGEQSNTGRDVKWGSAESFSFYNKINDLKTSWNSRQLRYNFVDANNIQIDDDVKFDLIYSGVSCGFHYPANTYKNLIKKHSHENTKIVFDLRTRIIHQDVEILEIIQETKKQIKAVICFTN